MPPKTKQDSDGRWKESDGTYSKLEKIGSASTEPEPSVEHDEHRGLAARILDLRRNIDQNERVRIADVHTMRAQFAQLEQQQVNVQKQLDDVLKDFRQKSLDLDQALRDSAEHVRVAGELARKMTDHVRVLDELRETQADPHDVVKPLRKDIGQILHDLQMLTIQVDKRFEALPRERPRPYEERGDQELDAIRRDIARLSQKLSVSS